MSDLDDILHSAYWTAGIFNSWTEGRGAGAFRNCSIKSVEGEFRTKALALHAAEQAIKYRMLSAGQPGVAAREPARALQTLPRGDALEGVE